MKVTKSEWIKANENLNEWRKNRTTPPALDLYKRIVSMVYVGGSVLDVGCGQCYLKDCLPDRVFYQGIDPFPISEKAERVSAEDLNSWVTQRDTVFMLAALDNVRDINQSLKGLKNVARKNIVILTALDVEPDKNHTVKVTKDILVKHLGEPKQCVELLPKTYLFEFTV